MEKEKVLKMFKLLGNIRVNTTSDNIQNDEYNYSEFFISNGCVIEEECYYNNGNNSVLKTYNYMLKELRDDKLVSLFKTIIEFI